MSGQDLSADTRLEKKQSSLGFFRYLEGCETCEIYMSECAYTCALSISPPLLACARNEVISGGRVMTYPFCDNNGGVLHVSFGSSGHESRLV